MPVFSFRDRMTQARGPRRPPDPPYSIGIGGRWHEGRKRQETVAIPAVTGQSRHGARRGEPRPSFTGKMAGCLMRLTEVHLHHFRNLDRIRWEPAPGLNLLWGRNGQGKTNLLEGIHLALTGRSFRTRRDEDLVPWQHGEDPADPTLCQAELRRRTGARRLRVTIGRGWKRAYADGRWVARLGELLGEASVVVFTPEDAGLFQGPPAPRRRFLDMTLSQLSPDYLRNLQQYSQAMRQLAAACKLRGADAQAREAARAYWPIVARAGAALMAARAARIGDARAPLDKRYRALGGAAPLELIYDPDLRRLPAGLLEQAARNPRDAGALTPLAEHYERTLGEAFDESRRRGLIPTGVHRDDLSILLDGQDLRRFGSQGQHRLAALTLKLESADWIEQSLGETPILLLDDFGSELDRDRRRSALEGLGRSMQVIVTATDREDFDDAGLFDRQTHIEQGCLADDET